jgi:thymidylate kinase
MENGGINSFIKKKRDFLESREGFNLHVEKKLITIDGSDGSGKDTIAIRLVELLKQKYGDDAVVQIDLTHLEDSSGNLTSLGKKIIGDAENEGFVKEKYRMIEENATDNLNSKDQQVDKGYIAGVNRGYENKVIPALKDGKIVVIAKSELSLIRFAIHEKNEEKMARDKECIENGTTTHGIWAGNRVFISMSPEETMDNINEREGGPSFIDPKSVEEAREFTETQKEAEEFIKSVKTDKPVNFIPLENNRVEKENLQERIDALCKQIMEKIDIG